MGLADLAVYEGRFADAVGILEKGAAADSCGRRPDNAADKVWSAGSRQLLRGQNTAACGGPTRFGLEQRVKTRFVAAQVFAELGEDAKARDLAAGLSAELQIEPQVYGKLIEGEIALKKRDGAAAIKLFTEANNVLDTWIGRFDLGRAYVEQGPSSKPTPNSTVASSAAAKRCRFS